MAADADAGGGGASPPYQDLFDPAGNRGRPVAAKLPRVAEVLAVPLAEVEQAARAVVPYIAADGSPRWSLMLLERQLGLLRPPRRKGEAWKRQGRASYAAAQRAAGAGG